jgi:hypothetical protein
MILPGSSAGIAPAAPMRAGARSRGAHVAMTVLLAILASREVKGDPVLGPAEERVIHYDATTNLQDPVAVLQRRLTAGKARLEFDSARGYLPSLLRALKLLPSSQMLVFSRTSSQADQTSPHSPRAIYFSDSVSAAWVPAAPLIDLIAIDPTLGPVFYTLPQERSRAPTFQRRTDCMRCHLGPRTSFVPGLVVRSFYTAPDGEPLASVLNFVNGHNSPLSERWGGWYVTGTHPNEFHLGNVLVASTADIDHLERSPGPELRDLRSRFNTTLYLTPHSDLVALLVLEHQVRMQNLLTRANYETRYALNDLSSGSLRPSDAVGSPDWPRQRIVQAGEDLLQYMLFRDEARLHGPLGGTTTFASDFARLGPRASDGRSLRQFDLQTRLFRYPCSYLVYSPAFDALPLQMKEFLWMRLEEILSGRDRSRAYADFPQSDREAVLQILRETKPEFAAWLNASGPKSGLWLRMANDSASASSSGP